MIELDRRRFLQIAGSASLLSAVGGRLGWASTARFVYIGAEHAIHVYSVSADERLVERQTIGSALPVAMAISGGRLYVANGVSQYGNLPRGSVEAYAIDQATGRLRVDEPRAAFALRYCTARLGGCSRWTQRGGRGAWRWRIQRDVTR